MTNSAGNNNVRDAALVLGALTAMLLAFCLGVIVGVSAVGRFSRAPFGIAAVLGSFFSLPGHGAVGAVTILQGNTLIIMDRLDQSRTINVSANTIIEDDALHRITLQDIHVGDRIAVIGSPSNGAINAVFVRLLTRRPVSLRLSDVRIARRNSRWHLA